MEAQLKKIVVSDDPNCDGVDLDSNNWLNMNRQPALPFNVRSRLPVPCTCFAGRHKISILDITQTSTEISPDFVQTFVLVTRLFLFAM